jgi:hypothetical protein
VSAAGLSATAAGVIALVLGAYMSWKGDWGKVRLPLLIAGSTTVVGGVFGRFTDRAGDALSSASSSATSSLFGNAVGVVGLLLLTIVIVRAVLKGKITRWTDAAAVITPPAAASFGGIVWAACLLVATLVGFGITMLWGLGAEAADLIRQLIAGIGG